MATAGPVILSFSGGSTFTSVNNTNQTVGWEFTVAAGAGVTVTDLGWWDPTPATPLGQTHQIGIWDLAGTLLGSTTVGINDGLVGAFRYASATPFALAGGTTYVIGAAITSPFSDFYVTGVSSLVTDPAITFVGAARSGTSSGFAAPLTVTAGEGRFGPNFQFTSNVQGVPEPSTLWITTTALGLLAAGRIRRKTPGA